MLPSRGSRSLFAVVVATIVLTVPAGVVLADPSLTSGGAAAVGAVGASESVDDLSDVAAGATASVSQTTNEAVGGVADAASGAAAAVGGAASEAAETTSQAADSVTEAASGAAQAGPQAAESVTQTAEEVAGNVAESVDDAADAVTGAASEAAEAVTAAASEASEAVAETAESAAGSASAGGTETASGVTDSVVGGTHADVPVMNGASSADSPSAVAGSDTEMSPTGVPAGTGSLIELDRAASGALVAVASEAVGADSSARQSFGAAFEARTRVGGSSGTVDSICEINLHRGRETADLPCPGGSAVLGLFLGMTGVALLSLVALALALTLAGTGAIAWERRLQRV
jgi:hypothetical protein